MVVRIVCRVAIACIACIAQPVNALPIVQPDDDSNTFSMVPFSFIERYQHALNDLIDVFKTEYVQWDVFGVSGRELLESTVVKTQPMRSAVPLSLKGSIDHLLNRTNAIVSEIARIPQAFPSYLFDIGFYHPPTSPPPPDPKPLESSEEFFGKVIGATWTLNQLPSLIEEGLWTPDPSPNADPFEAFTSYLLDNNKFTYVFFGDHSFTDPSPEPSPEVEDVELWHHPPQTTHDDGELERSLKGRKQLDDPQSSSIPSASPMPDPSEGVEEDIWYAMDRWHSEDRRDAAEAMSRILDHPQLEAAVWRDGQGNQTEPTVKNAAKGATESVSTSRQPSETESSSWTSMISSLQSKIDLSLQLAHLEGYRREAASDAWSAVERATEQAEILIQKSTHGGEETLHRLDSSAGKISDEILALEAAKNDAEERIASAKSEVADFDSLLQGVEVADMGDVVDRIEDQIDDMYKRTDSVKEKVDEKIALMKRLTVSATNDASYIRDMRLHLDGGIDTHVSAAQSHAEKDEESYANLMHEWREREYGEDGHWD